jgi:hypothetical protein
VIIIIGFHCIAAYECSSPDDFYLVLTFDLMMAFSTLAETCCAIKLHNNKYTIRYIIYNKLLYITDSLHPELCTAPPPLPARPSNVAAVCIGLHGAVTGELENGALQDWNYVVC